MKTRGKILFSLTGSIACFKACSLLSKLIQAGFDIEVMATKGALEFVGRASLEGLIGKPIHFDTFEPGRYMAHIQLAKWADLTLIYPASANSINKMAAGIGDDLVSTTLLTHDFRSLAADILIAPAMNSKMYQHPATQDSLRKLSSWGCRILETGSGQLACGDVGEGRLLEPEVVLQEVENYFASAKGTEISQLSLSSFKRPASGARSLHILITSGGSREAIDGVRAISNSSTGHSGAVIARHLADAGHHVTLLRAESAKRSEHAEVIEDTYRDFAGLASRLEENLKRGSPHTATPVRFDAVIHLAAVADYSVAGIRGDEGPEIKPNLSLKIESKNELHIRLQKNPKLVARIREWSGNPHLKLTAFKLTNTFAPSERADAVEKLQAHATANWIVQNDLHEIDSTHHKFVVYEALTLQNLRQPIAQLEQVEELAQWFDKTLTANVETGPHRIINEIDSPSSQLRTL